MSFRSKYSPPSPFSYTLNLCPYVGHQLSHLCKTVAKIMVLYVIIFTFLKADEITHGSEQICPILGKLNFKADLQTEHTLT
jgi:hypothetical protein